jgi:hypothetical protein
MENNIGIGILIAITFTSTVFVINTEYYTKNQKIILYFLFLFPPAQWVLGLILLLWNNSNNKTEGFKAFKISSQINDLKYLKFKGMLTEEEYEDKLSIIIQKEEAKKLTKSAEYKLLKQLRDDNILTEIEFKEKLKLLEKAYIKKT